MNFINIFRFELVYRFQRPATYAYFGLLLALGFMGIAVEDFFNAGSGQVKENSPTQLAVMTTVLSTLTGMFVISAVMGVAILRDFEHRTDSMMFTTPMKKWEYLFGRYTGSILITFLIFLGLPLGITIGSFMPWLDAEKMLPFNFWHILQPFLVFGATNVFIFGSIFFAGGALTRNILFVYLQGVVLLAFYLVAETIIDELEAQDRAALFDPFAINTIFQQIRYWTVTEQNLQTLSFSGTVLANRLIWMGVGIVMILLTYLLFNFAVVGRRSGKAQKENKSQNRPDLIPNSLVNTTGKSSFAGTLKLAGLYIRDIVTSLPFIAIALTGIVITCVNAPYVNTMYGTSGYPTTYSVIELLDNFTLFFIIIIIFYTGELIWRERDLRMNQIYDALPVPNLNILLSKFIAMAGVHVIVLTALMLTGICIQLAFGYTKFELGIYIKQLFGNRLLFLILFSLMGLFIQVIANQKFMGHLILGLFFIFTLVMGQIGWEHGLLRFAGGSLGTYSDMNHFGHFIPRFSWYKFYWFAFASVLFALSVLLAIRGTDTILQTRIRLASQRLSRPILTFMILGLILFISSGFYIFYNTTQVNTYRNSKEQQKLQAEYEKELKKYEKMLKPRIVATKLKVDLYPERRAYEAEGFYIIKNTSRQAISDIPIQLDTDQHAQCDYLRFEKVSGQEGDHAEIKENFEKFRFTIYRLKEALQPGDSLFLSFKVHFEPKGLEEGGTNTQIVYNGTFFNNTVFPYLGYRSDAELGEDNDRKKQGLSPKERLPERNDSLALRNNLFGDNADYIRFEITMSTAMDQIAIAPGYLQKEWEEKGRKYFHYKMDVPMANFYSMVSARYEVLRDTWTSPEGKSINLEIYYNKGHEYNLGRMMKGLKASLDYYTQHFSPYQYNQLRIMEFPRYSSFAQSFANTIPFSEGIGFMLKIDDKAKDKVDMSYYVTCHEVAHQWWGHQVMEAGVKGNAMLSETLSQYAALMVMKKNYSQEMMQKFLKYELDNYLRGRAGESKKEQPLVLVEGQGYIHYRKGSLAMFALQDYIGEDSVNAALRRYLRDWAFRYDRYPSSQDLMGYLRDVTPDSLQYLLTDMFETITLLEGRVQSPSATKFGDAYQVKIPISVIKYRSDSLGTETAIPIADWIDIGIYTKGKSGLDSLLYLKKHKIDKEQMELLIPVSQKPSKAGLDPLHKLIDRNPDDNIRDVVLTEE